MAASIRGKINNEIWMNAGNWFVSGIGLSLVFHNVYSVTLSGEAVITLDSQSPPPLPQVHRELFDVYPELTQKLN